CSRRSAAGIRSRVTRCTQRRLQSCNLRERKLRRRNRGETMQGFPTEIDVAVIGAGFSGMAMAVELKRAGREDFVLLERGHDLGGERVAVIGTGASAIQFVPQIQPHVAELHLFQRTAPWITPRMARPLTRVERALYRRVPAVQRLMRAAIYWGRELYAIPLLRVRLSTVIARGARRHRREAG